MRLPDTRVATIRVLFPSGHYLRRKDKCMETCLDSPRLCGSGVQSSDAQASLKKLVHDNGRIYEAKYHTHA